MTAVLVVLTSALVWGADLLRPSVRRDRVRTVRVETGALEASLTASGTVVPAIEHVISSPIDARVLAVLRRVGDQLKAGDAIVRLDASDSERCPAAKAKARRATLPGLSPNARDVMNCASEEGTSITGARFTLTPSSRS